MTCDYWECEKYNECKNRAYFENANYPPCAVCSKLDVCASCTNYLECCDLVRRYLPNMFRRLVREIRKGEDLAEIQRYIRKNTLNGSKRD